MRVYAYFVFITSKYIFFLSRGNETKCCLTTREAKALYTASEQLIFLIRHLTTLSNWKNDSWQIWKERFISCLEVSALNEANLHSNLCITKLRVYPRNSFQIKVRFFFQIWMKLNYCYLKFALVAFLLFTKYLPDLLSLLLHTVVSRNNRSNISNT